MEVTRKRYLALFSAVVATALLYVAKPEETKTANMAISITAQGKV